MNINCMIEEFALPHYLRNIKKASLNLHEVININFSLAILPYSPETEELYIRNQKWIKEFLTKDLSNISLALFGGLSELALSLWAVNISIPVYNNEINRLNSIIYSRLKQFIKILKAEFPNIKPDDFDAVSGLSGILSYCFIYEALFHELIVESVDLFVKKTASNTGWSVVDDYLDECYKEKYVNGYTNLSMSHGIIGPLHIMAKAYSKNIPVDGLKECINNLIDWFRKRIIQSKLTIPCIISTDNSDMYEISKRDSWSFGSTVMLWTLLHAADIVKNENALDYFNDIFLQKVNKTSSLENYYCISPSVLNGYGGILCVLKQYYSMNNEKNVDVQIKNIQDYMIKRFDPETKYGFQHFEYKCVTIGKWPVVRYDIDGFAYGALGVIMSLGNHEDIVNYHLLL